MSRIHKIKIVAEGARWNEAEPLELCLDQSSFRNLLIEQDGKTISIDPFMIPQIVEADKELRTFRAMQKEKELSK